MASLFQGVVTPEQLKQHRQQQFNKMNQGGQFVNVLGQLGGLFGLKDKEMEAAQANIDIQGEFAAMSPTEQQAALPAIAKENPSLFRALQGQMRNDQQHAASQQTAALDLEQKKAMQGMVNTAGGLMNISDGTFVGEDRTALREQARQAATAGENAKTREYNAAQAELDRQQKLADIKAKSDAKIAEQKAKGITLTATEQKLYDTQQKQLFAAEQTSSELNGVLDQIESIPAEQWTNGYAGIADEFLKGVFGEQDPMTGLRKKVTDIRNRVALDSLPKGAASDTDVALVMSGQIDVTTANPETLKSYFQGLRKINALAVANEEKRSLWLDKHKSYKHFTTWNKLQGVSETLDAMYSTPEGRQKMRAYDAMKAKKDRQGLAAWKTINGFDLAQYRAKHRNYSTTLEGRTL